MYISGVIKCKLLYRPSLCVCKCLCVCVASCVYVLYIITREDEKQVQRN